MTEFAIHGVALDKTTEMPLVVLRASTPDMFIGIQVGPSEASSIIVELEGVQPPRPLTHDLLSQMFTRHGFTLEHVEVYGQLEDRFLSRLHYTRGFKKFTMETRPSDALALAIRLEAPIFVDESCIPSLAFLRNDSNGSRTDFLYLENQQINSPIL
ncbi:MAG: bifunctional nuclease family protein [Spirochaetales bacterium]|nr:bifunctional nuclease family protein [Spirochaetales bacterium]